jgi:hypothetical protein
MGSQLAKLRKNMESTRKSVIAPYDDIVRGINKMVKSLRDPVDKATKNIKSKIGRYTREQAEIKRRIAQKKAREEAEILRRQMLQEREDALAAQKAAEEEAARKQAELDAIAEKEGVEPVKVEVEKVEIPEVEDVVVEEIKTGPVKTEVGTMSSVAKWTYEVEDMAKVPRDYVIMTIDDAKVKEDIDAGLRAIPGLRIYEDSIVRFRT